VVRGRQPAVTTIDEARAVLAAVEAAPGHPVVKLAMRVLALTALRPGEIRGARWEEIDLDAAAPLWTVPAGRMKMGRDHLVPLSPPAVAALRAMRPLAPGELVFPSTRHAHRPLSENAIGYAINRAGWHHRHVPHGWRAALSTILNEGFPADRAVIDLLLAHIPSGTPEAAYNRALHLGRRRELLEIWADMLMVGQAPLEAIVSGPRRGAPRSTPAPHSRTIGRSAG